MKTLRKILLFLTYLLPVVLFFSYHPVIRLGQNSSMNFELSLPLIWLVVFDISALVALVLLGRNNRINKKQKVHKDFPGISDRKFFFLSLFPFYATLSIFWSANPLRAILTAGIIWLLFIAIFAIIYLLPLLHLPPDFRHRLLTSFFASGVAICFVCWLQSFLDVFGVDRSDTLLCLGCTYRSFGFPHPSGFAIEPQFMGNLLLAPTLSAFYLLIFPNSNNSPESQPAEKIFRRPVLISLAAFFSATLFLTFSRGAIYAFAIGLFCLLIFALFRHRHFLQLIIIPVATFIGVLLMQGIFCVLGPTNETFLGGITKSIHQLSLGIIDLRPDASSVSSSDETTADASEESTAVDPEVSPVSSSPAAAPSSTESASAESHSAGESTIFEGYVADSTNTRLNLNGAAIDTWLSAPGHPESSLSVGLHCHHFCCPCAASGRLTPTSVLFGVGLGGAGVALAENSFITGITTPKEIVQNQFFSILLELGILGVLLIIFSLVIIFAPSARIRHFSKDSSPTFWSHPALPLLCSLIIAYLITLNFFSGLPNALHIYLLPPLLYLALGDYTSMPSSHKSIPPNAKPSAKPNAKSHNQKSTQSNSTKAKPSAKKKNLAKAV